MTILTSTIPAAPREPLPVPNLPLLRKVLEHVDANPDQWDQSFWGVVRESSSCGTACCIAGWALLLDGTHETVRQEFGGDLMFVNAEDRMRVDVAPTAQNLLGLTRFEASGLFHHHNSREQVQSWANRIASRAGEVL